MSLTVQKGKAHMYRTIFASLIIASIAQLVPTKAIAEDQAPVVAVFPLECKRSVLNSGEVQGLMDYMATKLSEHGSFQVIPSAKIHEKIRKMISSEKKRSYSDSVDEKSRMAIGKEFAAHYSITSKITKVGSQCLLMSKLFDMERATTALSATSRKSCKPEELVKGIDEIVEQFQQKVSSIAHAKRMHHNPDNPNNVDSPAIIVPPTTKTNTSTKHQPIANTAPSVSLPHKRKSLRGIGAELMLGPNVCIGNGEAKCENIDYSFGTSLSAIFRVIDYMAVEAMFFYGTFDISSFDASGDSSVSNMGVLVGVRGMIPIWKIDIMLDADIGWQRLDIESGASYSMTDGLGLAFGGGAQFRILDFLAAGIMFRYHLPIPMKLCEDYGEGENCNDVPDSFDQSHDFMFGVTVTGTFPF